jgi:ketosteroid isomerase-like protein
VKLPMQWADEWLNAWNMRDLEQLLGLYADGIELHSPMAKVYATGGTIKGKEALRAYWGEVMRRIPKLALEKIAVYSGHRALALHYRDENGRNCIESVLFDDQGLAILEFACFDRLR